MNSSSKRAGFLRLYMVDYDLSPGVITMLPLTGNSIFVGRNGVGKTSRMALIAFFLGAEPGEVVNRGKEKKFDEFYLPNTTSYLCMDYHNADGEDRCIMVYMSGSQLAYRLIQGHFDAAWVKENGRFIEAPGLTKRLVDAGVAFHPAQITTVREYRSIIQGVPEGRPSADYRVLRANYSLAGTKYALPKIDKIILGMIHKMVDLRSLQSIILACIQNDDEALGGDPQALMGQLQNIDELVQQGEALEQTEAAQPHFLASEDAFKAGQQANAALARLKSTIVLSLPKMEEKQVEQAAEIEDKEAQLESLREEYSNRIGELKGEIDTIGKQINEIQKKQNQLEIENLEWREKDPASMESRAANEEVFRQQLSATEDRLGALQGQAANIQAEFEKLKLGIRTACNETIEAATAKANVELDLLHSERKATYQDGEATLQELRDKHEVELTELNEKNSCSKSALAVLEAFKPLPDQAMLDARSSIEVAIEVDQQVVDQAQQDYDHTRNESGRIKALADQELKRKESKKSEIGRLQNEIKDLSARIDASNSSLLGFLRAEVPNWESSIGKVVQEDLLQRADLSPRYEPGLERSVYGLHLDLDALLPPQDEDSLKELLASREATLKDRRAEATRINKQLDDLGQEMSAADKAKTAADLRLGTAKDQLKRRRDERQKLLNDQQTQLRKMIEHNAREVEDAKTICRQCARDLANFKHESKLQIEEAREVQAERLSGIDERIGLIKQRLRDDKRRAEKVRDDELRQCETDLTAKLQAEGLDSTIIELSNKKERLTGELTKIKREAETLRQWREFLKRFPVEQAANGQEMDRLTHQREILTERREEAEAARDRESGAVSSLLRDKRSQEITLRTGISDLNRVLTRDVDEIEPGPEGAQVILDPEFVLSAVKAESDEKKQARRDLDAAFALVRKAFLSKRESEVARSWLAEELDKAGTDYSAMQEYLTSWYRYRQDGAHRVYLDRLSALKLSIDNFASSRDHFHASVSRFSSRLKKALSGIRISNAIENLVLNITSDSRDDSFMPKALMRLRDMTINSDVLANDPHARDQFVKDVRLLRNKLQDSNTLNMKPEQMISITGQVTENGHVRRIDRTTKIDQISSSGLSVMVQSTILMAFIDQVRGDAPVDFPWGVDELGTIDDSNIVLLVEALNRHHIHLITAQPNVTASTAVFKCFKWALKPTPSGNIQATPVSA